MKQMKLIVLLFCLVVQFIANAQLRIIEGTAVDISQRPFQAAIFINGEFTCLLYTSRCV